MLGFYNKPVELLEPNVKEEFLFATLNQILSFLGNTLLC